MLLHGKPVYETVYSDALMMFWLKAHDRKRYGDKLDTTLGPNWSGNLEDLPDSLLAQISDAC